MEKNYSITEKEKGYLLTNGNDTDINLNVKKDIPVSEVLDIITSEFDVYNTCNWEIEDYLVIKHGFTDNRPYA